MEKHILSKSTFVRSCQCLKSLHLYKNKFSLRDPISSSQQAIFNKGTDIGMVARGLFPGGEDATPSSHFKYSESVIKTRDLIRSGTKIIYEAAFQFQQVLVAVDMLVKHDDGWKAYEVKSATRVSPTYILDASLQYHVIINCGIPLVDFSIININSDYRRKGKLEADKLFRITSVIDEVIANTDFIKEKIELAKSTLGQKKEPDVPIGEHCFSPYVCDFKGYCWHDVPENSVFEVAGISKNDQFEMFHKGYKLVGDIPADYPLPEAAQLQVKTFKSNEVFVDMKNMKEFLDSLFYPLCFLDFETFMPAIPLFENTKPYQHIPFQYSLHIKAMYNSEATHKEFLAQAGADPRKEFLLNLLEDTKGRGDILVYNAMFEKGVLNALKLDFPEYVSEIEERLSRIKDLMMPFQKRWFYHPAMKGSYSIKNVLPALVKGLDYDALSIGTGSVAMTAYEQLHNETDLVKIMEVRENLLNYCKMDTFGMVKIHEVLEEEVRTRGL